MPPDQRVLAHRCIDAIQRGDEPDLCNRKVALLIGQKASRIAGELVEAARTLGLEKNDGKTLATGPPTATPSPMAPG
jgi:hypothetical protein